MSPIIGIIPARYASTRLPGKPLLDLKGKSMIQRVYESAAKSQSLVEVWVATDDQRIHDHVLSFGGKSIITGDHHPSGTDRVQEAFEKIGSSADFILNIQGDEPLISPEQIDEMALGIKAETQIATMILPVTDHQSLFHSGEVKITLNHRQEALYFSRSVIPFLRNIPEEKWHEHHPYYRHAGMYAYRKDILKAITQLPPSALEQAESLEQLRWLENGYLIQCIPTQFESMSIDTPEDVTKILPLIP